MINEYLRCPNCGMTGEILLDSDFSNIQKALCTSCGHKLPVYGGIPDFAEHIPLIDHTFSPPQKAMNSRIFAILYESPV